MGDGRRRGKRREEKRREMRLCHVKKEQEETLSEENGGEAGEGAINLSRKRVSGHYIRQAEREAAIKGKESQKKNGRGLRMEHTFYDYLFTNATYLTYLQYS